MPRSTRNPFLRAKVARIDHSGRFVIHAVNNKTRMLTSLHDWKDRLPAIIVINCTGILRLITRTLTLGLDLTKKILLEQICIPLCSFQRSFKRQKLDQSNDSMFEKGNITSRDQLSKFKVRLSEYSSCASSHFFNFFSLFFFKVSFYHLILFSLFVFYFLCT